LNKCPIILFIIYYSHYQLMGKTVYSRNPSGSKGKYSFYYSCSIIRKRPQSSLQKHLWNCQRR